MFAYSIRRILTTIPLLIAALYLVHVGVSYTTDPLGPYYLCLPRCQDAYDAIEQQYELDKSIWVRPFTWVGNALQGDLGNPRPMGPRSPRSSSIEDGTRSSSPSLPFCCPRFSASFSPSTRRVALLRR